jgi:iron(III) transport system permease protein
MTPVTSDRNAVLQPAPGRGRVTLRKRVRIALGQGTLVPLVFSLIAGGVIIAPVLVVLVKSLTTTRLGDFVGLNVENYLRVLTDPKLGSMIVNSLVFAVGSAIFGTALGATLAWIVARTNTPGRALVELLPLYPLLMPPIMKSIAWILLLSPRSGILNNLLHLIGIRADVFNAYSMPGMIFVFGLACVPLGYLFLLPVFLSFDPSLEESAYIAGSKPVHTMFRITFPLAFPAFLSALILNLMRGLRAFETPVLQGIPAGITVFVSRIYDAMAVEYSPGLAAGYSVVLILFSFVFLLVYIRVTRFSERYSTITGKGYRVKVIDIGGWKYVTFVAVLVYFFVGILIPLIVLIITSLLPYYDFDNFMSFFQHITSANYVRVVHHRAFLGGLYNSLIMGVAVAGITVLLGIIMAFTIYRTRTYGRKVFEFIATVPMAFPALVLTLGIIFIIIGTPVYKTVFAIGLGMFVAFFPYAFRNASGAIVNIHKELDEVAWVHGARWRHVFFKVTLPLLKPSMFGALFYIFIEAIRNIDVAILLTAPGLSYGPVTLMEYYQTGQWAESAAGGVIYLLILVVAVSIAKLGFKVKFSL